MSINDFCVLIGCVGSILLAVITGLHWISVKIDAIRDDLQKARLEAKDFVTHAMCHARRESCPCYKAWMEHAHAESGINGK